MKRNVRLLLLVVSIVQLLFAAAFVFQVPFVVNLWPLSDTTPLSFMFIGSIFAAAAASTLWCLYTGEDGALAGIGIDYVTILAPVAVFIFTIAGGSGGLILYAVICLGGVAFGMWLYRYSSRIPINPVPPMPRIVYWSFVVFVIALLIAGGQMVLKTPNVLPWRVTIDSGVVFGWMFIGAAAYFAYSLVRPSWHNTGGQLAGFLAYDIVLIVPFLQRLPAIAPELRLNMIIYIIVVSYSGLLAAYYLFVNPSTRMFGTRQLAAA